MNETKLHFTIKTLATGDLKEYPIHNSDNSSTNGSFLIYTLRVKQSLIIFGDIIRLAFGTILHLIVYILVLKSLSFASLAFLYHDDENDDDE